MPVPKAGNPSLFFDVGNARRYAIDFTPALNTPTFVAFVKDAVNDELIFYLSQGGSLQSSTLNDTSNNAPRTDAVNIGVFQPGGSVRQFNAVIDNVGFYNTALTAAQNAAVVPEPRTALHCRPGPAIPRLFLPPSRGSLTSASAEAAQGRNWKRG